MVTHMIIAFAIFLILLAAVHANLAFESVKHRLYLDAGYDLLITAALAAAGGVFIAVVL